VRCFTTLVSEAHNGDRYQSASSLENCKEIVVSEITRREFLRDAALASAAITTLGESKLFAAAAQRPAAVAPVKLSFRRIHR
jgi:hypothetical protein